MGITLEYCSIHKGAGVSLIPIANDIFRISGRLTAELPFLSCWKTSASSSPYIGRYYFFNHLFRRHFRKNLYYSPVTALSDIVLDLGWINSAAIGQDPSHLFLIKGDLILVIYWISCFGVFIGKAFD